MKASEMYGDNPEILEDLYRCANDKANFSRDMEHMMKSTGEKKFFSVKYSFIPPNLVLVQTEDISEKKNVEKKLKEESKRMKILNEKFLKFGTDPPKNIQLLVNAVGELLEADCALYNRLIHVNGKEKLS